MHPRALRPLVSGTATTVGPSLADAARRARRAAFVAQVKAAAAWARADVDLTVHPDVDIARGVRLRLTPWTHNALFIGEGCRVEPGVLLALNGGSIRLVHHVEVRRDAVLDVRGDFVAHGDTPISWNCVIHCDQQVVLHEQVGLAEQVTIADSSHFFTTPEEHFWHNRRSAPVVVGRNTWLCPKVTVARGVTIGEHCIVGSNSAVVTDVPAGSLASGVPATVRPLPLPWRPTT